MVACQDNGEGLALENTEAEGPGACAAQVGACRWVFFFFLVFLFFLPFHRGLFEEFFLVKKKGIVCELYRHFMGTVSDDLEEFLNDIEIVQEILMAPTPEMLRVLSLPLS
jgi:hypothetical protein